MNEHFLTFFVLIGGFAIAVHFVLGVARVKRRGTRLRAKIVAAPVTMSISATGQTPTPVTVAERATRILPPAPKDQREAEQHGGKLISLGVSELPTSVAS
jgi:hypothetical protein